MHKKVKEFCESVKARFPKKFVHADVLDAGSLDINGNSRYLFKWGDYVGVDVVSGKNVDVVCPIHEYKTEWEGFDVIISTEAFEHDMHLAKSLKRIVALLAPRGLFMFTCATTGRREHGTTKSHPELSPTPELENGWADYYCNVTEDMVRDAIDIDEVFKDYEFSIEEEKHTLQFWGTKKKE